VPITYDESVDVYSTQAPSPQRYELEVTLSRQLSVVVGEAISLGEISVQNPTGIIRVELGFDGDGPGNEFARVYLAHILPSATLNAWQRIIAQGPTTSPSGDDVELAIRVDAKMIELAVVRTAGVTPARVYGTMNFSGLFLAQLRKSVATYAGLAAVPIFSGSAAWTSAASGPPPASYTHTQGLASSVWTINHALGYKPIPAVYNLAGDVVEADVSNPTLNQTVITFAAPQLGSARFI
jgi:hypothetical protein